MEEVEEEGVQVVHRKPTAIAMCMAAMSVVQAGTRRLTMAMRARKSSCFPEVS